MAEGRLNSANAMPSPRSARTLSLARGQVATVSEVPSPRSVPRAVLVQPEDEDRDVAPDVTLVLDVIEGLGFRVEAETVAISVNDRIVWEDGGPRLGWTGAVEGGAPGVLRYTLSPSPGLTYRSRVTVRTSFAYGVRLAVVPVLDAATAVDVHLVEGAFARSRTDAVVVADAATLAQEKALAVVDLGVAVDAVILAQNQRRAPADASVAEDAATLELRWERRFTDEASAADVVRVHPSWERLGDMPEARRGHALHLLTVGPNAGKVLLVGGSTSGFPSGQPSAITSLPRPDEDRCFLYDPATDLWTFAAPLLQARLNFASCRLADGRLLVAGGTTPIDFSGRTTACEIYDPRTDAWTATGPLARPRALHTLTLLDDGTVLAAGGSYTGAPVDNQSEIFDPALDLWIRTAFMPDFGGAATDRWSHEAILLDGGDVLLVSGVERVGGQLAHGRVMRYATATGTWSYAAPMPVPLRDVGAAKLPSGKVLAFGGVADPVLDDFVNLTQVYDPVADAWATGAPIAAACGSPRTMVLADGRVLHGEGSQALAVTALASEVYSEPLGTWTRRSDGLIAGYAGDGNRLGRNIVRLADGTVLATAQGDRTVEKFTP
jgi:hypothetical protein